MSICSYILSCFNKSDSIFDNDRYFLQRGTFSNIWKIREKPLVIKEIVKTTINNFWREEIDVLINNKGNKHIIELLSYKEYTDKVCFLLPYYKRDFFEYITNTQYLDVKKYTLQMLDALSVLHGNNYAHLDIKPENFMINKSENLILADFGGSVYINEGLKYIKQYKPAFSPNYMPPELFSRIIGYCSDIWAMGIVIYIMKFKEFPCEAINLENKDNKYREIITKVRNDNLLSEILIYNYFERPSLNAIYKLISNY